MLQRMAEIHGANMGGEFLIQSEGDLEVVCLYEAHSLLADVISDSYYRAFNEEISFHTQAAMTNFYVHVDELFSEHQRNAFINGRWHNISLLTALERLCQRHPDEGKRTGLLVSVGELRTWLDTVRPVEFWCPGLNETLVFSISRKKLINFAANMGKHSLLRLSKVMSQLIALCQSSGVNVTGMDVVAVREPFLEEVHSRLMYLGSWLVELLGQLFLAINTTVIGRFSANPTNRVSRMHIPHGTTSEALAELYGSTLVFKRYTAERITNFVPKVPETLKRRY
jgi:hypothetical protein